MGKDGQIPDSRSLAGCCRAAAAAMAQAGWQELVRKNIYCKDRTHSTHLNTFEGSNWDDACLPARENAEGDPKDACLAAMRAARACRGASEWRQALAGWIRPGLPAAGRRCSSRKSPRGASPSIQILRGRGRPSRPRTRGCRAGPLASAAIFRGAAAIWPISPGRTWSFWENIVPELSGVERRTLLRAVQYCSERPETWFPRASHAASRLRWMIFCIALANP